MSGLFSPPRLFVSLILLVAAALSQAASPIIDIKPTPFTVIADTPQNLGLARHLITLGAAASNWSVVSMKKDTARLRYQGSNYWADIRVDFTPQTFSISYLGSTRLEQTGEDGSRQIHPNYNVWVSRLVDKLTLRTPLDPDTTQAGGATAPVGYAQLYYFRPRQDYENWGLHVWGSAAGNPTSWYSALRPDSASNGWIAFRVTLSPNLKSDDELYFIVHRGEIKDDCSEDRAWDFRATPVAYVVQGDCTVYASREDASSSRNFRAPK